MSEMKLKTVGEMATLLRVAPSWIYARTRPGGTLSIPHIKIGKYLRFDADAVLAALTDKNSKQ